MLIPQLKTKRLILREFQPQDFKPYAQICSDTEIMRYIGNGQSLSREQSWCNMALLVGHWQLRGYRYVGCGGTSKW